MTTFESIFRRLMMCSEDEEAVQQAVYSSDADLAGNGGDTADTSETKEGETSNSQMQEGPKKLTKQDIDNMTDDQVVAQALQREQDNYEAGVGEEVVNRVTKVLQRNQTGGLQDKDRQSIVNALANMMKTGK